MTGKLDSFIQGETALRNTEDWTKEHRDAAIARANEMAGEAIDGEEAEETDSYAAQQWSQLLGRGLEPMGWAR